MPGKCFNVVDPLGLPGGRRRAADAAAEGNANTGGPALERANHQFMAVIKVESHPVQFGQGMEYQRGKIGCIGHSVRFTVDQTTRLLE